MALKEEEIGAVGGIGCCLIIVIGFLLIFVPLVIGLWRWSLG